MMKAVSTSWANPSSQHKLGLKARDAVEASRHQVALSLSALNDEEIVFVSGGTEACNMVIHGALQMYHASGRCAMPHVVASSVEHDAVAETLRVMQERNQCSVSWVSSPGLGGGVLAEDVLAAVTRDTCLVTVMLANNETGVINDVASIASRLSSLEYRRQFWLFSDGAQAFGKIPVNVRNLGVDLLSIVGHKFHGPRFGALYVSSDCVSPSSLQWMLGGHQERGLRAGTENTAEICGLAEACSLVRLNLEDYMSHMLTARVRLEQTLLNEGVAERFNVWQKCDRLPNTCSVVLATSSATAIQVLLQCRHLAASTAAACHSQNPSISGVLLRSGVVERDAIRTVRLSVSRFTTFDEIDGAVNDLKNAIVRAEQEATEKGQQLPCK